MNVKVGTTASKNPKLTAAVLPASLTTFTLRASYIQFNRPNFIHLSYGNDTIGKSLIIMGVITIILAIILVVCLPIAWWYLSIRRYKSLEKIPGPKPLPLIGNAHQLGQSPEDLMKSLTRLRKLYGGIFKVFIGGEIRVVFSKPHLMEYVLGSNVHINKSDQYHVIKPWLGEGLTMSSGAKWRQRRKMITPTFYFKILEQFMEVFNSQGRIFVENISKNVDKVIDITRLTSVFTLDVICETAMGIKMNAQKSENREYAEATSGLLAISMVRFFSLWKRNDFLFTLSSEYKLHKKYLSLLQTFNDNVINKRREEFRTKQLNVATDEVGQKRKVALLDLLLGSENANELSNEDLRDEINTFMLAGHDTTSTAISFALLCLAENPYVQERLYQEVISIIGSDTKSPITMGLLQDLKYMEMVIRETLRIYTVVPSFERRLEHDSHIDGLFYPAGTTVVAFAHGLHHSEEIYPDPCKFDPDRFLPGNTVRRHPYAYIPFSAGPRNCIGQRFAMLEMKATLAHVVREFEVLPVPGYKPVLGFTGVMTPLNGIQLRFEHRQV